VSSGEDSEQCLEGLAKIGKISNVEDLLKTGLLDGIPVTCLSEVLRVIMFKHPP
jgi:hypothetical protein